MLVRRGILWLVLAASAFAAAPLPRLLVLDAALVDGGVIAVGERGTIVRSSDRGQTWTKEESPASSTLTGVTFGDNRRGWAVGHDGLILASTDAGRHWSKAWQSEALTDSFLDVLALDPQHVIAIGAYGLCVVTEDGGRSWNRRKIIPDDYHLNRISRGPTGTLYVAGEHGTLLRSTDQGGSWTPIPTEYDGSFYGILPLGARVLLAHGLRGRTYRSEDDGDTWQAIDTHETVLLATAIQRQTSQVILAGQARAWLVSDDGGRSFRRRDVGVPTGIAELLAFSDGDVLVLGEAGATLVPATRIDGAIVSSGEPKPRGATQP